MSDSVEAKSVLGTTLHPCSMDPLTGFFRDGCCKTGPRDRGSHTICAVVTEAFLEYSKAEGNDLSTPRPEYNFVGLKPGDAWCLCASRWADAMKAGCAPAVRLESTHERALQMVTLAQLVEHSVKD